MKLIWEQKKLREDGRDVDERARADSIIIATLDNNNKEVKINIPIRDT